MNKLHLSRTIKLSLSDISSVPLRGKNMKEVAEILENEYSDFGKLNAFGNDIKRFENVGYWYYRFENGIKIEVYQ